MRVASDQFDDDASWLANVLHPEVGAELVQLVESTGARVVDVIEQHSIWPTLARAQIGIDFEAAVDRRIRQGAINNAEGTAWLEEQHVRDQNGTFRATITKRLVVAHAP